VRLLERWDQGGLLGRHFLEFFDDEFSHDQAEGDIGDRQGEDEPDQSADDTNDVQSHASEAKHGAYQKTCDKSHQHTTDRGADEVKEPSECVIELSNRGLLHLARMNSTLSWRTQSEKYGGRPERFLFT